MLYDSYHKKITQLVKSLKTLLRCIVILCIVNVVIFIGIVTFMATKGIVFDSWFLDESFEITYGEKLPLKSHAFFARVFYEYSEDGEEWTREEPDQDGDYMVRASAKGIFGKTRSGKVYTYALNPKEIDVTVSNNQITYGDFPNISADLAFEDKIVCDKVIYTDRLATKTNVVPSKDGFKILNADGKNVTKLYDINFVTTQIEILPRDITITVPDKEIVYNGLPLTYNQYEITEGTLAPKDVIQATFDKVLVDVTGDEGIKNTPNIAIFTYDGLNVGTHYNITMDIGILKIIPRPIIVKTASDEKVYDDKALINNSYQVLECPAEINANDYGLIDSHKIIYGDKVISITDVGRIDNWLDLSIVDATGADKTENYALEYDLGELIVTPRPITVSSQSGTWMYDGKMHTADVEIKGFCPGHVAKYSWPEITDAGTVENTVTISSILSEDGRNVLSNYEIIVGETGTLTVNKRPITIKHQNVATGSVTYDGVERTFAAYEITSELGLAENDTLNIIYPTFSQAGTYENENKIISANVFSHRENGSKSFEISENYEVTEVFGTIVIDKCKITIEPRSNSKEYDGFGLSTVGYRLASGVFPSRHTINVVYKETAADVGEYLAEIDVEKTTILYNEKDVKSNFEITVNSVKLTIRPRRITIQAGSATKPYDGTPITSNEFSFVNGSLAEGQKIVLKCIGSQTRIGKSANVIDKESIVITDANDNPISKNNYDIICEDGVLEILLRKLAVTTNSKTKVYDATELSGEEVIVDAISDSNDGLLEGHKLVYTLSGSIINVGKIDNEILSIDIVDQNGRSVQHYYEKISITKGVLEIIPVKLTINTGSKYKIYDKKPLVYDYYEIDSLDKLCGGDTITVTVDGTITDVGDANNTAYHVIYNKNGEDVTLLGNYEVTYNFGTLQINPRIIRVLPLPTITSKVYNGTPLKCHDYTDISNVDQFEGLMEGDVLSSLTFTSITDVGKINIGVNEYVVIDANDNDISGNYKIIVDGDHTLEVTKRRVVVESFGAEKKYDGRPLTNSEYYLGTLVSGHYIDINITGRQLEVGESPNTISEVIIYDENGEDVTSNYDIEKSEGTLRVYQIVVAKVKSNKGGYIYLKTKSYGDYDPLNNEFGPAPIMSSDYSFTYSGVKSSYMLWSSATLMRNAYYQNTLEVTEAVKYMLPYYMAYGGNYTIPNSSAEDYTTLSSSSSYTVPYYDYSYEKEGTALFRQYYNPSGYYNYTKDVKSYYITVPESTKVTLDAIIAANEFNNSYMTTEEQVRAVAIYIRSIGTYNLDYNIELDNQRDVTVAFLTNYHEGSSKHFALAAMMLYRQLGIPARYVEGYYVETEPNVNTEVTIEHSWVEVFVPRYGWMQVEVTPGFGDYDLDKEDLTVKPVDLSKPYDGDPLEAKNEVEQTDAIKSLINQGYKIEVVCRGSRTEIGTSSSTIESIKIFDAMGRNVTYKFNITTEEGILEVTKIPIKVCFYSAAKTYDGEKLENTDYTIEDSDFIATGYKLEIAYIYDKVDVYTLTIGDIMNDKSNFSKYFSFRVMNGDEDITHLYYIDLVPDPDLELDPDPEAKIESPSDYIVGRINPKTIEIASESVEAVYVEGKELKNGTVTVIMGPLLDGHRLVATTTATLKEVGSIENTVNMDSIFIFDAYENEVSQNYNIIVHHGVLTFLPQKSQ